MAKVEFYEVIIKDKKEQILFGKEVFLNNIITKYLENNDENKNFCQGKNCAVILNNHIKNNDTNIIFDFAKFTDKKNISTLISKPLDSEDTFEEYHKKILETTKYTEAEQKEIEELISLVEKEKLIEKLKINKMDKFKIYKIIKELELLKKDELELFEKFVIKRLTKNSIFFNIIEEFEDSSHKILLYQNLTDGLDIKYLEQYLNTHLLIKEDFKLSFHKLYDADFMDLLQNGDLNSFMFSYNVESKNNLLDKNLFNPLYSLGNMFGKNITKVEIKSNKDEILDNEKLIDFFEKATESGLLDTCELKQKGGGNKKIDFKDKNLNIEYTENTNIDDITEAILFFERALKKKKTIVKRRLGI
jgi:hypothetical protein